MASIIRMRAAGLSLCVKDEFFVMVTHTVCRIIVVPKNHYDIRLYIYLCIISVYETTKIIISGLPYYR